MALVGVGLGYKSYMQVGRETTYGSAVAATHKLELISEDITPQTSVFADPSIYNARSPRAYYSGGTLYKGKIKVRANYTGLMMLLDWAFGGDHTFGTVQGHTTGAGPTYTHTFLSDGPILNSYTVEIVKGDVLTTKCFKFSGVKCAGLTISGQAGTGEQAMVTVELDVIGNGCTTGDAPTGALNLPTVLPVMFTHGTVASMTDGTGDSQTTYPLRLRSFEVTLQNALADDRWYIGSASIDEPIPNGMLSCKWKLVQEFYSVSPWTKIAAGTSGALALVFTNTHVLSLASGTAYCSSVSAPVSGYGIMTQTTEWNAAYDTGNTAALKAVNTNTVATIATAY